jgi:hypothetical protein
MSAVARPWYSLWFKSAAAAGGGGPDGRRAVDSSDVLEQKLPMPSGSKEIDRVTTIVRELLNVVWRLRDEFDTREEAVGGGPELPALSIGDLSQKRNKAKAKAKKNKKKTQGRK